MRRLKSLSTVTVFKHIATNEDMIEITGARLKALQGTLFDMLVEILDFFEDNGIEYTLAGGTCLGAIRHKGFIPWDDDVDLNMPRSSYEKLLEVFDSKLGARYWLHTPEKTENYGLGLARIRKKGTAVRTKEDIGTNEVGACIDIFIIENAPDLAPQRVLHGIGSLALGFALSCRRFYEHGNQYLEMVRGDAEAESVFKTKMILGKLFSFRTIDDWCHAWNSWNSLCHNESSEYIVIPAGRKHYFGALHLRRDYFPVTLGVFEGKTVKLPANTDEYLASLYGDYMAIPAASGREAHAVFEFDLGD